MESPCNKCIVQSCCSEPCIDYAAYVYDTGEYKQAGKAVEWQIDCMSREDAIKHILKVESIHFYMRKIELLPKGAKNKFTRTVNYSELRRVS